MNSEKRNFDKGAAAWDEVPGRVKLATDIAGAICDEIKPTSDMDVLDFGCGTGLVSLKLQPLVRSITGLDSSPGMLDVFRSKIQKQNLANAKVQYIDFEKGDMLTGSYDLIISSMTLHHVKEIRPLISQFYHVAAPSGQVCIADLDLDSGQFHDSNEGVFHFGFDRGVVANAFVAAGFYDVRDRTAATVIKTASDGGKKTFTVFLISGRKP